jgi:hypothetical protein
MTALPVVAALAVIALPVATALAVILTAPPASARAFGLAKTPGQCRPRDQPCTSAGGGTGIGAGISVTVGGLTECSPSGVQISTGVSTGGSLQPWVPFPCSVPAATRAPRPASSRPRPPVTVTPVPAPVTAPAVVTQVAPVPRPHRPRPRPRPATFRPAPEGLTADAYAPGRPVMPIGVLITVVLTPCVLTVAARLGKLLSGR